VKGQLETAYREHAGRALATLIRLLGDFDAAEEALHDAFLAAAERWPREGTPANPCAWLVSAGRFKAIDRWRRRARLDALRPELEARAPSPPVGPGEPIADDELRLIFTCCHPALAPDARIALTLREVCGLTTEEIARAYLVSAPTIAQRIVRAKAKIRDDALPYEVPERSELAPRLESVLHAAYLIFNEGYAATSGPSLVRPELASQGLRLARRLVELLDEPEALGLLALMLLHDARRETRTTPHGDVVLLEDQDRSRWDRKQIAEGVALVQRAFASRRFGPYTLQAAIAAVHAEAATWAATDWSEIVAVYDVLARAEPSPVVRLNRAVAIAMRDGPEAGLTELDAVLAGGEIDDYSFAHSSRGELLRRLDRSEEARAEYERALALTGQESERRFLEARVARLTC